MIEISKSAKTLKNQIKNRISESKIIRSIFIIKDLIETSQKFIIKSKFKSNVKSFIR